MSITLEIRLTLSCSVEEQNIPQIMKNLFQSKTFQNSFKKSFFNAQMLSKLHPQSFKNKHVDNKFVHLYIY